MTTTYTWTVNALWTVPNPEPDYVVQAQYTVDGTDGTYSGTISSNAQFTVNPDQPDYVPYADLTEAIVIGWIQAQPNVTINMEACVQGQIDSQINPPVVPQNTPLPWSA